MRNPAATEVMPIGVSRCARSKATRAVMIFVVLAGGHTSDGFRSNTTWPDAASISTAAVAVRRNGWAWLARGEDGRTGAADAGARATRSARRPHPQDLTYRSPALRTRRGKHRGEFMRTDLGQLGEVLEPEVSEEALGGDRKSVG